MKQLILGIGMIILAYIGLSTQRIIAAVYIIGEMRLSSSVDVVSIVSYIVILLGIVLCVIGWKKA